MSEFKFTDAFLDTAYVALLYDGCKTERDKQTIDCICEVCAAEGISVRKYMSVLLAVEKKMKEENGDE